jgi:hypothetical protein
MISSLTIWKADINIGIYMLINISKTCRASLFLNNQVIINTTLLSHSLIVNVVMVIVRSPKNVLSNSYYSKE